MEAILEYVRQGNPAPFDDRSFVKELHDWVRFNATDAIKTGDGLAGGVGGQPSIPSGLGRRIFSLTSSGNKQADINAKAIRSSAGIIAFVGERDDKASGSLQGAHTSALHCRQPRAMRLSINLLRLAVYARNCTLGSACRNNMCI